MISSRQIRAARALLGIRQSDLAKAAKLSTAALLAIEQEQSAPRTSSLIRIQKALINFGVGFGEGHGVHLLDDIFHMNVFEGPRAFETYMNDVIDTLSKQGGKAYHSSINEMQYIRNNRKIFYDYYKTFKDEGLHEQLLIRENIKIVYGAQPMAEYRWMSDELFNQVGYSVYGQKYVILMPQKQQRFVVIENAAIAETFKRQFKSNWKNATIPRLNKPLFLDDCATYK